MVNAKMSILPTISKLVWAFLLILLLPEWVISQTPQDDWTPEKLWRAVRLEKSEDVKAAIAAGVDINSTNDYGATALHFAADRANKQIVEILLDAGADPLIEDSFYNATPLTWAQQKGKQELVLLMLARVGDKVDPYLLRAVETGQVSFVQSILKTTEPSQTGLLEARKAAMRRANAITSSDNRFQEILDLFESLDLPEYNPPAALSAEEAQKYLGQFQTDSVKVKIGFDGESLTLAFQPDNVSKLQIIDHHEFSLNGSPVIFQLNDKGQVQSLKVQLGFNMMSLDPVADTATTDAQQESQSDANQNMLAKEEANKAGAETSDHSKEDKVLPKFTASSPESLAADRAISSSNWPGFRGNGARGVAEGQNPPVTWNINLDTADTSPSELDALKWKTAIPGLGLSSPSIWEDRIYLTSAVAEEANDELKIGLYGDVSSVKEDLEYQFYVYCLDKHSGSVIWERKPISTKPAVLRHAKSSHANPTVATDGQHVIAFFGSEGLFCYDHQGELQWSKDLGFLDSGWFYDASYQWGFGSSPIIFENSVIVQCDIQENSFVAAFALSDGAELWRTDRQEIPSWSTPTVHAFGDLPMLITHATQAARGYDARSGELLWSLGKHSEIVVPTPFVAHNLIYLTSGYSPVQPIIALHSNARGEIDINQLGDDDAKDPQIAWGQLRHGPYMPTPVVYGDYLYVCSNNGILRCYVATSGEEVYQQRLRAPGGNLAFTASLLAGDGHIYLTAEDGRVLVVKAGPEFELVSTNPCGESVLATPAISDGVIYIRTHRNLLAIQQPSDLE